MVPLQRHLRCVAQQFGRHLSLIERWSAKYRWVARADAWDIQHERLRGELEEQEWAAALRRIRNLSDETAHNAPSSAQTDLPVGTRFRRPTCHRLRKESDQAFEAFRVYLQMDPVQRSLRGVAQHLGRHVSLLERWSAAHHWGRRTGAWDDAQDRYLETAEEAEWLTVLQRDARAKAEQHIRQLRQQYSSRVIN
jgi:hypothetical protein